MKKKHCKIAAEPAVKPKAKFIKPVGWIAVALILVFEGFVMKWLVASAHGGISAGLQNYILSLMVLFPIPFLLGMKVSRLMRGVSMAMTVFLVVAGLSAMFNFIDEIQFAMKWHSYYYDGMIEYGTEMVLGILCAVVLWGRWPFDFKKAPKK